MKKKILLVGGCGFIGHNLAIELSNRGHKPYVIDSLAINNIYSIKDTDFENKKLYTLILNNRIDLLKKHKIPLKVLDARDYHLTSQSYSDFDPDVIVHLAAISHANKSNKDPHTTFDHTLRTLENTLDIAKSYGSHFIYFSSSMIYGNFSAPEVDENTVANPLGIYGALKYSAEKIELYIRSTRRWINDLAINLDTLDYTKLLDQKWLKNQDKEFSQSE